MPTRQGGRPAKKLGTSQRRSRRRTATDPSAATPCTWKTLLARSRPIVITCIGFKRDQQGRGDQTLTLKAPMQREDGTIEPREAGTPQGGVVSPILANLFLHYAFDMWMARTQPAVPFERYA